MPDCKYVTSYNSIFRLLLVVTLMTFSLQWNVNALNFTTITIIHYTWERSRWLQALLYPLTISPLYILSLCKKRSCCLFI